MVSVKDQYEAFPYPERVPEDERTRLITGSPSDPREIDHFLYGGKRDWSVPLKVLFAGGGTGDGLIQLAQLLTDAGREYEITYVDLSGASRKIAEKRAKIRKLDRISFHTGSLLEAAEFGKFDYIDCCGVLHHLPDPLAGFRALRAALADGGGMGFMVYAPLGRSGVYPLQRAFGTLFEGMTPSDRLEAAKALFEKLPPAHPFKRNVVVGDHKQSDAGFYDLLLHGQDRAYSVPELLEELEQSDWRLVDFVQPGLYDPRPLIRLPQPFEKASAMALAEDLFGTQKTHAGYAVPKQDQRQSLQSAAPDLVPHIKGAPPEALARLVSAGKPLPVNVGGRKLTIHLPKELAPMIAKANGISNLKEIWQAVGLPEARARGYWQQLEQAFLPWGLLLYSNLLRKTG